MTEVATSRLIIPALGGIYRVFAPYTETLIRIVAGLSFVPHGYPKLFINPVSSAAFLEESGFRPGMFWAILLGCTEVFGGLLLAAGFLTRLACIPIFIFLLTAITHHWPNGFTWIERRLRISAVLGNRGVPFPDPWRRTLFGRRHAGAGSVMAIGRPDCSRMTPYRARRR